MGLFPATEYKVVEKTIKSKRTERGFEYETEIVLRLASPGFMADEPIVLRAAGHLGERLAEASYDARYRLGLSDGKEQERLDALFNKVEKDEREAVEIAGALDTLATAKGDSWEKGKEKFLGARA